MRKIFFIILFVNASVGYSQSKEWQNDSANHKWEISISLNTPEPLTTAGFDYNALTQRIFINGDRQEYSLDLGIGCSRKLHGSIWFNLNFNYAFYRADESRDSRNFYPISSSYELSTLEIRQIAYEFVTGLYKRFAFRNFQVDFGGSVRFKYFSAIEGTTIYSQYDTGSNQFVGTQIYDQSEPGGFCWGLSPVVRLNYRLCNQFSLGFKFSPCISYYKTGGSITTYKTNIYSWGGTETGLSSISSQTFRGIRFLPMCFSFLIAHSF